MQASSIPHEVLIRSLIHEDIPLIINQFSAHNWPKPASTFEKYHTEQQANERDIWLAFYEAQFAGYVTLTWQSLYPPFKDHHVPEIMDLNVLPPYRNKGIGSLLIDTAEHQAFMRSKTVGIGVGLYAGYGSAQKLYIAKGYQPDGLGVTYNYQSVTPGKSVCLDDDLVLWFTKNKKMA
ncbi:MAG: GNAT family N-acetyltransferase [Gammaproteobacteria bacterium]|nr:GNAT family N-acetyltransferase [Gammaproteobacteria bacterium]